MDLSQSSIGQGTSGLCVRNLKLSNIQDQRYDNFVTHKEQIDKILSRDIILENQQLDNNYWYNNDKITQRDVAIQEVQLESREQQIQIKDDQQWQKELQRLELTDAYLRSKTNKSSADKQIEQLEQQINIEAPQPLINSQLPEENIPVAETQEEQLSNNINEICNFKLKLQQQLQKQQQTNYEGILQQEPQQHKESKHIKLSDSIEEMKVKSQKIIDQSNQIQQQQSQIVEGLTFTFEDNYLLATEGTLRLYCEINNQNIQFDGDNVIIVFQDQNDKRYRVIYKDKDERFLQLLREKL